MATVLRFLGCVAAVPLCALLLPQGITMADWRQAALLGAALGLGYLLVRPVLRVLLKPLNFCTLGLAGIALDALLVWAAAEYLHFGVSLASFWWALPIAAAIAALRTLADMLAGRN